MAADPTQEHEHRKDHFHRCTDFPCCILFLVAIAAWVACYIYGGVRGNPNQLFRGLEPEGDMTYVCGVGQREASPYLYWCIKESPAAWQSFSQGQLGSFVKPVCTNACPETSSDGFVPVQCGLLPFPERYLSYKTSKLFGRFCMPNTTENSNLEGFAFSLAHARGLSGFANHAGQAMFSIVNARWLLVGCFFMAIILGYLYLFLLKCCAEPLIWVTMILTVLGFFGLGLALVLNAGHIEDKVKDIEMFEDMAEYSETGAKILGAVCLGLSALLCCGICCFCRSIHTAAAILNVACDTMWEMPILLLMPVMKCIVKGALALCIAYGFVLLFSTAEPKALGADGLTRTFDYTTEQNLYLWYFLFGSLWLLCFAAAFYEFVVAYIVADYYYAPYDGPEKDTPNQCVSMCQGIGHGLVTHAGSLAFGSLIVAIIKFIQAVLNYAQKKNQALGGNQVIACMICCIQCCFKCCEEVIEFINKNAYIDIAISGVDNFCTAARNVMEIIISQGGAMYILNGATVIFSFFGILLISLLTMAFAYGMLQTGVYSKEQGDGSSASVPAQAAVTIVAGVIAFIVGLCFFDVFDMTADTLLYCFGYDRAKHRPCSTAPEELRILCDEADSGEHS